MIVPARLPRQGSRNSWIILGFVVGAVAILLSYAGLQLGKTVLERGVTYADPTAPVARNDDARAVNTQLELELDDGATARSLDLARDAGFTWIRQQVSWAELEPGMKGNFWDYERGRPTWTRWDTIIRQATDRGIKVVARLELPPEWARPRGSYKSHPPSNVRDYADFVAAFTARYRDQITHVQLWNEPNLSEEWGRRPIDVGAYVELLRAGAEGARRGNPKIKVLTAALAQTLEPDSPLSAGLSDLLFLDRMYDYGAAPFFDIVAANGYGLWTGPDDRQIGLRYTNLPRLTLVRELMVRRGDAAKSVWVSEFGWNAQPETWTGRPSPWGRVDEATQARFLVGGFDRAQREWLWLGPMAVWLLRQPLAVADDPTPFFALIREDWSPRPAYDALVEWNRSRVIAQGLWQDDAAGISYVGTWQVSANAQASGASFHETPAPNAHVRFTITGTRFDLVAPFGPTRGTAYVSIDGSYLLARDLPKNQFGQAKLDFGAPTERMAVRVPIASGLPDGHHVVEITVSGESGTGSSGPGVGIDGVIVGRDRSIVPETAYFGGLLALALATVWSSRRVLASPLLRITETLIPNLADVDGRIGRGLRYCADHIPLVVVGLLPLAPIVQTTPLGQFSILEIAAVVSIAVMFGIRWIQGGRPVRYLSDRDLGFVAPSIWKADVEVWFAVLVVAGGTIGAVIAQHPNPAWREWRQLIAEPVLWFLLARSSIVNPTSGRRLAVALLLGAAVASGIALVQSIIGSGTVGADGVERARAFYGSPNNLALLLSRTGPLAVAIAICGPRSLRRAAWVVACLILAGCVATYSRGGIVALSIGIGFVVWQGRRWNIGRLLPRWLVGTFLLGTAGLIGYAQTLDRFRTVLRIDGTGMLRLSVWTSAMTMLRDYPWLGIGLDQFVYFYPAYLQADAWREPNLSHPHQFVLDFWLRLGIFGLIGLLLIIIGLIRNARRPVVGDGRDLRTGAVGGVIAICVHGLVDNSYFVTDLAYATWALLLLLRTTHVTAPGTLGRSPS